MSELNNQSTTSNGESPPVTGDSGKARTSEHEQKLSILEKLEKKYKNENGQPKGIILKFYKAIWILVGVIFLVFILSQLGFIKRIPFFDLGWLTDSQKNIHLISTGDQELVLLIKQGDKSEVRLLNPVTGTAQDISLGDPHVSHAALSPNEDVVAYVSTSDKVSTLYLFSITNSPTTLMSSTKTPTDLVFTSDDFKVCEWSKLYWAPQADRLAFFGCTEQDSALFIVSAKKNSEAKPLENTKHSSMQVRDAVWLENGNIVFTAGKQQVDSLLIIVAPDPTQQQFPQRLYGPQP